MNGVLLFCMWCGFGGCFIIGNNIAVDTNIICHFSGKPSTTRLSKAKYLLLTRFRDPSHPFRMTSPQKNNIGSTSILLLYTKYSFYPLISL